MILIKCCKSCVHYKESINWCRKHMTGLTHTDWCPDWEFEGEQVEKIMDCLNCRYFKSTYADGKTHCSNPDQWNTWIKPEEGCEKWKEKNDND